MDMDAPAKPTKPAPRPRPILAFVARVLQVKRSYYSVARNLARSSLLMVGRNC
jgi:hypothetical protein